MYNKNPQTKSTYNISESLIGFTCIVGLSDLFFVSVALIFIGEYGLPGN